LPDKSRGIWNQYSSIRFATAPQGDDIQNANRDVTSIVQIPDHERFENIPDMFGAERISKAATAVNIGLF